MANINNLFSWRTNSYKAQPHTQVQLKELFFFLVNKKEKKKHKTKLRRLSRELGYRLLSPGYPILNSYMN